MGKQHTSRRKKKTAGTVALVVCLVLFVLLIGATIGRYQTRLQSESAVRAKEFYFTSDLLDGGTHTLAPGSTEVTFTLGNHADELRFSEVEIEYEVTVEPNSATVEYDNASQKLGNGGVQDAEVTISNLQAGTYIITATGKGGYEKTLTATINVLTDKAQLCYHQENFAEYTLLTVWNEGEKEETVTIEYTGIPDNTNPNMTGWTTGGPAQTVPIGPHESKVFRFFGANRSVTVTGAISKTPS